MRVPLNETAIVVLNGSGSGTARLGPLTARETWYPTNASVKTSLLSGQTEPVDEASCLLYAGQYATDDNFRDRTFTGSSGDASGKIAGRLQRNEYIFAAWQDGDAGVSAYLTVTGEKDV